jgi:hypothetical protein
MRITNSQVHDVNTSWLAALAVEHSLANPLISECRPVRLRMLTLEACGKPRLYPSRVRSPMVSAKLLAGFALSGGGEILIGDLFRLNADQS